MKRTNNESHANNANHAAQATNELIERTVRELAKLRLVALYDTSATYGDLEDLETLQTRLLDFDRKGLLDRYLEGEAETPDSSWEDSWLEPERGTARSVRDKLQSESELLFDSRSEGGDYFTEAERDALFKQALAFTLAAQSFDDLAEEEGFCRELSGKELMDFLGKLNG